MKSILITGCAGFIGYSLSIKLLKKKFNILGIDNLNSYYDKNIKLDRLKNLQKFKNFSFYKLDISKKKFIDSLQNKEFDILINLAAQPGIRYSILNPHKYIDVNVKGFLNVIEFCKKKNIKKIYYASSSSVYGGLKELPFKEDATVNKPLQIYAVTKITNELMAEAYAKLYKINFIGFRFFTVYGPYGRPDMSIYKFTDKIYNSRKITINGNGNYQRDFTFIDDITNVIFKFIKLDKGLHKLSGSRIFNIGNGHKISINKIIEIIEKQLKKKAGIYYSKSIEADMEITHASFKKLENIIGKSKKTNIETGIKKFIDWYLQYKNE